MGRRSDIGQHDLRPDKWRQLAREYSALPTGKRAEFLVEVARRTTLSRATIHRRFHGRFPTGKRGRKPVTAAEQRQLVVSALERFHGRISAIELWADVLGAPVAPGLPTVRRICRQWRETRFVQRQADATALVERILGPADQAEQVPLPLGPDRPTMFAGAKARPTASDAMAKLTEALDAAGDRR